MFIDTRNQSEVLRASIQIRFHVGLSCGTFKIHGDREQLSCGEVPGPSPFSDRHATPHVFVIPQPPNLPEGSATLRTASEAVLENRKELKQKVTVVVDSQK
jgi:hypothetical protein